MNWRWSTCAAALVLLASGCGESAPPLPAASAGPGVAARQRARQQQLGSLRQQRDQALAGVERQRADAARELRRLEHVHAKPAALSKGSTAYRYGSDGTGDPPGWKQTGPDATRAPNSTAAQVAMFHQAEQAGRIALAAPAQQQEIDRGLIDDRILALLVQASRTHTLQVNSLRLSHAATVQDELGTPAPSNHAYGRSADISAVDGVPCRRETTGAPYRTLLDNPVPPGPPGPCLRLALELEAVQGTLALGEVIYYWRVPGPTGVSLPNHDDHVHIGYRNYPGVHSVPPAGGAAAGQPGEVGDPKTLSVPRGESGTPSGSD